MVCFSRFPSNPFTIRVPFFLLFNLMRRPQNKGQKGTTRIPRNPNDWAISAVNRFAGCIIFSNGFKTCTQSQKHWAVPWLRLGCFCLDSQPAIGLHRETTTNSISRKTFVMRCRIRVLRCRGLYDDDHKNARRDHHAANKLRNKKQGCLKGHSGGSAVNCSIAAAAFTHIHLIADCADMCIQRIHFMTPRPKSPRKLFIKIENSGCLHL